MMAMIGLRLVRKNVATAPATMRIADRMSGPRMSSRRETTRAATADMTPIGIRTSPASEADIP
jgi:hypothetical protein